MIHTPRYSPGQSVNVSSPSHLAASLPLNCRNGNANHWRYIIADRIELTSDSGVNIFDRKSLWICDDRQRIGLKWDIFFIRSIDPIANLDFTVFGLCLASVDHRSAIHHHVSKILKLDQRSTPTQIYYYFFSVVEFLWSSSNSFPFPRFAPK